MVMGAPGALHAGDVVLVDPASGGRYALRLAKNKNGTRQWKDVTKPRPWSQAQVAGTNPSDDGGIEFVHDFLAETDGGFGEFRRRTNRYYYSKNVTRSPGLFHLSPAVQSFSVGNSLTGSESDPAQALEFPGDVGVDNSNPAGNNKLHVLWGRYFLNINIDSPDLTGGVHYGGGASDAGSGNRWAQAAHFYDGVSGTKLYLTQEGGKLYSYSGGDTEPTLEFSSPALSCIVAGSDPLTGPTLYAMAGQVLKKCGFGNDPATDTSWVGTNALGTSYRYFWMTTLGYAVMAHGPTGSFRFLDEAFNAPNIFEGNTSAEGDNGLRSAVWDGAVWIRHAGGLYRFDGETVEDMHPFKSVKTTFGGFPTLRNITCMVPWKDSLLVAVENGDTYVFQVRLVDGQLMVDPLLYVNARIMLMHICWQTASGLPRLFLFGDGETQYYVDLPRNLMQSEAASLTFAATGEIYGSLTDCGLPGVPGVVTEVGFETDSAYGSGGLLFPTAQMCYSTGDDSWSTVGADNKGPVYSVSLGTPIKFDSVFGLGLQLARGDTDQALFVRKLWARIRKYPEISRELEFTFIISDYTTLAGGQQALAASGTILAMLRSLCESRDLITVVTPTFETVSCLVSRIVGIEEVLSADTKTPQTVATVAFRVVP